jgi:hypothetical protein
VEEESTSSLNDNDQSNKSITTFTSTEEVTWFHHRKEVGNLISNLFAGGPAVSEDDGNYNDSTVLSFDLAGRCKSMVQLRRILDEYLEYPSLLDPFLEELLVRSTLMDRIRQIVHAIFLHHCSTTTNKNGNRSVENQNLWQQLPFLLSFVYTISKVCGRKKVQRFFPHEASDVEPVLYALRNHESIIQTTISGTAYCYGWACYPMYPLL